MDVATGGIGAAPPQRSGEHCVNVAAPAVQAWLHDLLGRIRATPACCGSKGCRGISSTLAALRYQTTPTAVSRRHGLPKQAVICASAYLWTVAEEEQVGYLGVCCASREKGNAPKWDPARLQDRKGNLEGFFAPLPALALGAPKL